MILKFQVFFYSFVMLKHCKYIKVIKTSLPENRSYILNDISRTTPTRHSTGTMSPTSNKTTSLSPPPLIEVKLTDDSENKFKDSIVISSYCKKNKRIGKVCYCVIIFVFDN